LKYDVRISELRQVIVSVDAGSMAEASRIARLNWTGGEYVTESVPPKSVKFESLYPNHSALGAQPLIRVDARKASGHAR
jgi:hypothetical protein